MHDVYELSKQIAKKQRKRAFLLPPSRIFDIEIRGAIPSIFRLHTLTVAYKVRITELLKLYGIRSRV